MLTNASSISSALGTSNRERAKDKAASMTPHIGYPDELLDRTKLTNLYDKLEMGTTDYLRNALNLTVFGTNYSFRKLRQRVNKTDWVTHGRPAVVNAFYSPLENSIRNISFYFCYLFFFTHVGHDPHSEAPSQIPLSQWNEKCLGQVRNDVSTHKTNPDLKWNRVTIFFAAEFPAGILQGAFFGKERPAYLNYAAIGWVIGHEITHGFDDQGRQFGPDGNLVEWWAPSTKQAYLERAQCIINQYGNYTVPEVTTALFVSSYWSVSLLIPLRTFLNLKLRDTGKQEVSEATRFIFKTQLLGLFFMFNRCRIELVSNRPGQWSVNFIFKK